MSVSHHVPEDWILAYAVGSMDPARQVLVSVHLTYCPACRDQVDLAERIGAQALAEITPIGAPPRAFEELLARLDEPVAASVPPAATRWPAPLAPFVPHERWSWLAPSTWGIDLDLPSDGALPARLVWMRPGAHLPHVNGGEECAVVLQGGWSDESGHFGTGDFALTEGGEEHDQRIDPGEPCIALVLNEQRAIPAAPWSLLGRFFRI